MELDDTGDDTDDRPENKNTIILNSSPKVQKVLRFLTVYVQEHDATKMKGLIFVQRRHTAKILYHVIKKYAIAAKLPIRPDFMVGNNAPMPESIEAILENKVNRRVLDKFNRNETNLIVASSVLEEGVDLQVCNLVMSYDSPVSFRSYVQSKGRARMADSQYVICTLRSKQNEITSNVKSWMEIDRILKSVSKNWLVDFSTQHMLINLKTNKKSFIVVLYFTLLE